MNIIYMLTNTTKTSGKRYYIGSKAECQIQEMNGVPTMISRQGKPYYGSSSCPFFKEAMLNKDIFSVEVLENVPQKSILLEKESYWINHHNAVESDDFYNLSDAVLGGHYDQDAIINMFGETINEYATNESSMSNRDTTATENGFNNSGEMILEFIRRRQLGESNREISLIVRKGRHFAQRLLRNTNIEKVLSEIDKVDLVPQMRKYIMEGASIKKACELLGLEWESGRYLLGDYNKKGSRMWITAHNSGLTKEELEDTVISLYLDKVSWKEISKLLNADDTSLKRYLFRGINRYMSKEDLECDCSDRFKDK